MNPEDVWQLADNLHEVVDMAAAQVAEGAEDDHPRAILKAGRQWVDKLRKHHDALCKQESVGSVALLRGGRKHFNVLYLVKAFWLSTLLHADRDLTKILIWAARCLLTPGAAAHVERRLRSNPDHVPSASVLSKRRLSIDTAVILLTRESILQLVAGGATCHMMIDSSPQGGRDYELALLSFILPEDGLELLRFTRRCACLRSALPARRGLRLPTPTRRAIPPRSTHSPPPRARQNRHLAGPERQAALPDEHRLIDQMAEKFKDFRTPPVVMGSGGTSLAHKFHAFIHALFLLSGGPQHLSDLTKAIMGITTDLGTESGLHRIMPLPLAGVLPWAVPPKAPGAQDDEWPEEAVQEASLDLTGALGIPGILHIVHNISVGLTGVMEGLTHTWSC